MVGARGKSAGEGNGKLLLNEDRVSVWGDEKFWRWMVGWLHSSMSILDAAELST